MTSKKRFPKGLLGLMAALLLRAPAAWAARPVCADLFDSHTSNPGGAALEMELDASETTFQLITTVHGLAGDLFPNEAVPPFFSEWVASRYRGLPPKEMAWSAVPFALKQQLLAEMGARRNLNFQKDRTIPFLKIKDPMTVNFKRPVTFMGTFYKAGSYDLHLGDFFEAIEYGDPDSVQNMNSVELHLRSGTLPASALIESARVLQEALGIPYSAYHEHLVAAVPKNAVTAPIDAGLEVAEYYRRGNMVAEMLSVFFRTPITASITKFKNETTPSTLFGPIDSSYIRGVFLYFAQGAHAMLGQIYKTGWIGFRGADSYDQPGVYGFEYRVIGAKLMDDRQADRREFIDRFVDRLQKGMNENNYGFSAGDMHDWHQAVFGDADNQRTLAFRMGNTWYRYGQTGIAETVEYQLTAPSRALFGDPAATQAKIKILERYQKNKALFMVLHNWSKDPLLYNNPAALHTIEQAQTHALSRLFNAPDDEVDILRDFIIESQLLARFIRSFGLDISDLEKFHKLQLPGDAP